MENIKKALGSNAKFYSNYLATNHLASDFVHHLDSGILKILEENKALKTDRKNAISKMSKSWQHNTDDYPDLLSKFVDMANRQFDERDALREALRNLVSSASDNEEQLNDVLMCSDYGESKALCDARKILAKINKV